MADTDPQNAGNQEEPQRPDWLPQNFKDEQAFVSSYKELERTLTTRSEREKELEQQVASYEEMLAQQQSTSQPQVSNDALYTAYENDPVGTMAWLAQQAAQQAVQSVTKTQTQQLAPALEQQNQLLAYAADQLVSQRLTDWGDYREKVADEISRDPDLLPESAFASPEKAASALERVYKIVKFSDVESNARTLADQQAERLRQEKLAAQTLHGSNSRPLPPDEAQAQWDRIKNAGTASYADLVRNAS